MANYYASARSNYFSVKDPAAFKEAMADFEVDVHEQSKQANTFCLLAANADGVGWPTWIEGDEDEEIEINFFEIVGSFLADEEVAIFMEAGAEKLRYIVGEAHAVNNKGDWHSVSLNQIYDLAKELGENVSECSY